MVNPYVGAVAGGTLGFIAGDVPGAVIGAVDGYTVSKLKNYSQRNRYMVARAFGLTPRSVPRRRRPIPNTPSGRRVLFPGTPVGLRGGVMRTPRRTPRASTSSNGRVSSGPSGSSRTVVGSKRGSKAVLKKRKPKVKVSNSLRKKIKKVMNAGEYRGKYKMTTSYFRKFNQAALSQRQFTEGNIGINPSSATRGSDFFTPLEFLQAASVMWNDKVPDYAYNFGDPRNFHIGGQITVSGAERSPLKMHIVKSWATMRMTNQTRRTFTLKLLECKPKKAYVKTNTGDGAGALYDWIACSTDAAADGSNVSYYAGAMVPGGQETVNVLGNTPEAYKGWNARWHCNCTTITLEPGQSYNWQVSGPSDQVYDSAKFFESGTIQTFQKWSKSCFIIGHLDLVGSVDADGNIISGRYLDNQLNTTLAFETTWGCTLSMPKKTGFTTPGGVPVFGDPVQLGNVRDTNVTINWPQNSAINPGAITRVDEQNPF